MPNRNSTGMASRLSSGGLCYECELYAEPLSPEELAGLCVNYEPRPESPLPVAR
jgi:hypothetical protein